MGCSRYILCWSTIASVKCMKSFSLGFVGKNCEVDMDACALPNATCPPRTQCLDLPDSLEYTCRLPCPQNLQVGKNILMHCLSSSAVLNLHISHSTSSVLYMFKELPIFCLVLLKQFLYVVCSGSATVSQQQETEKSKLMRFYLVFFKGVCTV